VQLPLQCGKQRLTLFVAGEYPDSHLSQYEVSNRLWYSILQLVLDSASTNQRQVLFDLVVDGGQPRLSISHRNTDIIAINSSPSHLLYN